MTDQSQGGKFLYRFFPKYKCRDFVLTQYGYHKWSKETKHVPVIKDSFILHVILEGQGWVRSKNRQYRVKKGDAFLIKPAELIDYYPEKKSLWTYIWIGIAGNAVEEFIRECGVDESRNVLKLNDTEDLFEIIDNMVVHTCIGEPDLYLIGKMYEFLSCFQSKLLWMEKKEEKYSNANLRNAINYINLNFYRDISIGEICRQIGVERSGLYRMFKKQFGISPQKYILKYRLVTAENYVTNTDMSFKSIAIECGFNNYTHFFESFRKTFGMSPKDYRKYAETEKITRLKEQRQETE